MFDRLFYVERKFFLTLTIISFFMTYLYGDIVWPDFYRIERDYSLFIIFLSLVVEFFFYKKIFKLKVLKAFYYTAASNFVSSLVGYFLTSNPGILWEMPVDIVVKWVFDLSSLNIFLWITILILDGAVNSLIELLTIKVIWKRKITKKIFILIWLANTLTVAFAAIWVIIFPPYVHTHHYFPGVKFIR